MDAYSPPPPPLQIETGLDKNKQTKMLNNDLKWLDKQWLYTVDK
jgi:hypothetical protein